MRLYLGVSGRPPPSGALATGAAAASAGGLVGEGGRGEGGQLASKFSMPLGECCCGAAPGESGGAAGEWSAAWPKAGGSGCGGACSSWPTPAVTLAPLPPLGGVSPAVHAPPPPVEGGVGREGGLRCGESAETSEPLLPWPRIAVNADVADGANAAPPEAPLPAERPHAEPSRPLPWLEGDGSERPGEEPSAARPSAEPGREAREAGGEGLRGFGKSSCGDLTDEGEWAALLPALPGGTPALPPVGGAYAGVVPEGGSLAPSESWEACCEAPPGVEEPPA